MLRALLVLWVFALPAKAEEKKVSITFLGGAKKPPIEGLKVSLRLYTADWTVDRDRKAAAAGTTDKTGTVALTVADGKYYVDLAADKEVPYLRLPPDHKEHPVIFSRRIAVGDKTAFEFNLADACKLTLRAVDAETGAGILGVVFVTENALAEYWGLPINGDNIGAKILIENWTDASLKTDKDGNFVRFMGPRPGYTYYVMSVPKGYERPDGYGEVELETPLNTTKVEHVFKIRKKK